MIVGSQSELHSVRELAKSTEGNTIVLGISKTKSSFDRETQVMSLVGKSPLNVLFLLTLQVLSLNVRGRSAQALPSNSEVLYRIYAAEPRIVPRTSLCLLWNPTAARCGLTDVKNSLYYKTNS